MYVTTSTTHEAAAIGQALSDLGATHEVHETTAVFGPLGLALLTTVPNEAVHADGRMIVVGDHRYILEGYSTVCIERYDPEQGWCIVHSDIVDEAVPQTDTLVKAVEYVAAGNAPITGTWRALGWEAGSDPTSERPGYMISSDRQAPDGGTTVRQPMGVTNTVATTMVEAIVSQLAMAAGRAMAEVGLPSLAADIQRISADDPAISSHPDRVVYGTTGVLEVLSELRSLCWSAGSTYHKAAMLIDGLVRVGEIVREAGRDRIDAILLLDVRTIAESTISTTI